MTDILIIPDAHAHPDYDNERFSLIGKAIVTLKPEVVVCLGDFADMPSLSSYDRGKASFEGKRYWKDIECTKEAYKLMMAPLREYQESLRAAHRPRYNPRLVMVMGNHEERINTASNANPQLHGTFGMFDLPWYQRGEGWEVAPFNEYAFVEGINFVHHVPMRNGKGLSSKHLAYAIASKTHVSTVVGHSHLLDYYELARPDGSRFFGLSAGCFGHPNHDEGWSRGTDQEWWRGLTLLRGVENGYWKSMAHLSMKSLEEEYGCVTER